MAGSLVLSLDFELLWGVRDHATRASYGANIRGGRAAVPEMLDLFEARAVRATWATVGFLFCRDRDDLMAHLPPAELRPRYRRQALSNYGYLDEVGADEATDPDYYAPGLIARIARTPGQEIATHTLAHGYALEPLAGGPSSAEVLAADLAQASALAAREGLQLRSIVFPRNQFAPAHLEVCRAAGLTHYRGTPKAWAYRPAAGQGQTLLRRGMRLVDAYAGGLGPQGFVPQQSPGTGAGTGAGMINVPASHFLRPCAGRLARAHPAHIRRLKRAMTGAARAGQSYHLWWHPHNFGRNPEANLAGLETILDHFAQLRDRYGMTSRTMAEMQP